MADIEVEFDHGSMWSAADRLMSAIKAGARGKPVGYTSFGLPQYHPGFPFAVVSRHADFTIPQVYWADLKLPLATAVQTSLAYYRKFGVPVVPIGQSYGPVTPEQIKAFIATCAGLSGFSFWDWQHCTTQMWEAVISGQVREVTNVLARGSKREAVKKLQQDLNFVLGTISPWTVFMAQRFGRFVSITIAFILCLWPGENSENNSDDVRRKKEGPERPWLCKGSAFLFVMNSNHVLTRHPIFLLHKPHRIPIIAVHVQSELACEFPDGMFPRIGSDACQ